ncbi:DUF4871 domain-containing protein [Paenibacillus sp. DMB20]|uniref:DUF4871 domain-containing protein n=1 Tax=Paenibacillus sp. DMB20 TaxID=1642570 RepID=UPI001F40D273|nr:DUF4871 domain-containing protein [Paenibacillus sp. DMB20]
MMSKANEPDWTRKLQSQPFDKSAFTKEMAAAVLERSNRSPRNRRKLFIRAAAAVLGSAVLLAGVWLAAPLPTWKSNEAHIAKPAALAVDWMPRLEFRAEDGAPKLQMVPGGDYAAGAPAGSWWNLYAPVNELLGQTIRIRAIHQGTGMEIEELPPTKITKEMGYDDFTRVTSRLALPLAGLWRFDVTIGGASFGHVVADVPDGPWEPSPDFRSSSYTMTGVQDRLGFINPGFRANRPNKYMWHFWGRDEELNGEFVITAVKKDTAEIISVFEASLHPGKLNGSDASHPTSMTLPSSGLWRLMVSINGRLFGSVIVKVEP